MRCTFSKAGQLVKRCCRLVASALALGYIVTAAAQQTPIMDPLLGMPSNFMTCERGWRCDGRLIRNPASMDSQVIVSKIRDDGRAGFILPINVWTVWPRGASVPGSGATVLPPMPAVNLLQKLILPQRIFAIFPGAKLAGVQQEANCPRRGSGRTDCAIALLNYTSRENQSMEALVNIDVRYDQPGAGVQSTDTLVIITFAPSGQVRSLPLTGPQLAVNPQWHQQEQMRAAQFSRDYQARMRQENGRIVATGQQQLDSIHQWGETVLASDRHTQNAIDESSAKFAGYVGDQGVSWSWRNTQTGEIIHTDHNESPGPNWVAQ